MPARKKKPRPKAESVPLEEAIDELTSIVQDLETGQQSLDVSLENFERGIQLMKQCDQQLQAAAGRIEQLQSLSADGVEDAVDFDSTATARRTDDDDAPGSLF